MSLHFLPREIIKYITDFLDNQDYLSTILSSKIFSLSEIDKQARKDTEFCVKYHKDEYFHLHSKKDILLYAYKHQRKELIEKYSVLEHEVEIITKLGDLEALKKVNFNRSATSKRNTAKLICEHNHTHMLKYIFEDLPPPRPAPHYEHLAIGYENDYHDLVEYMSRFEGNGYYVPSSCTPKIDEVYFRDSRLLTLVPGKTEAHKDSIKSFLENKINENTFFCNRLILNQHTRQNLEILQLSNNAMVKILESAIIGDRLNVVRYLIQKTNYIPEMKYSFTPKIFFYLLDLDQNRNKEEIIQFLFRNPEQVIRLFNRFPNLKSIITVKLLIRFFEERINRNLFCFLFRLSERSNDDIFTILIECKDDEICKFLFSELERNLKEKFKDFLKLTLSNSLISEEHRRIICTKYINCMSLTKLIELL